ncbi:MAG: cell division protein FtsX [Saprospiraceae bacterium]
MANQPEKRGRNKPNYVYTIISVSLVLFLIGFFGLIILQAQRLVQLYKERVAVMIELAENVPQDSVDRLQTELQDFPFVKPNTTEYVSREEAVKLMQDDFGDDFLKLGLPNPFSDVVTFNVNAQYLQADSLSQIRSTLKGQYSFITDVFYQESVVDSISANIRRITYVMLGLGIFLILIATVLIHNTVRLALYANRFLIKNMELVGASWEFISKPYLVRGGLQGLLSGIIAVVTLALALWGLEQQLPDLKAFRNIPGLITLFSGLIILGILINLISTYYVVRKYLKMRVDDLY